MNRSDANPLVQPYVDMFDEAEDATFDARQLAERDRDYYDGKQLTAEEVAALKKRGQPPIVINRIRRKINWYKGLEVQRRTDPRAFPRTPDHAQGAEAATDAIKFVCDKEDWDSIRSKVYEDMLIEGFGGCEVIHKDVGGQIEVVINHYPWDRLFYDPYSRRADFEDARYKGAVIWTDADALKKRHKDKADEIQWTLDDASTSETYDDRPKHFLWADSARRRVRVVLLHFLEDGKWKWCLFHKGGKLDEGESPYVGSNGESVCPLVMQSMYCDRDNNRYGIVRDMVDPQDEVNKRRSKALHLMTLRQTRGEKGAVDSVADMKAELARPDGHVEVNPDMEWDILPTGDLAAGQVALLNEAKAEIDMMGANSALAGEGADDQSGRAVLARQQGGMVEIASEVDHLHQFTRRIYESVWMRVRQFWTEERWIRVTDEERNVRFVGLNRPVTLGEQLQQMPEEQALVIAREMGLRPNDPRFEMPVGVENAVEEMDVDIQIEEVPDQISLAPEQFQAVMGLAPAILQSRPQMADVVLDLMVSLAPGLKSDDRDKLREGLEAVRHAEQQGGGMQQQLQNIAMQKQVEQADADIRATNAKAVRDEASAFMEMARPFKVPV